MIIAFILLAYQIGIYSSSEAQECRDTEIANRLRDGAAALHSADSSIRYLVVCFLILLTENICLYLFGKYSAKDRNRLKMFANVIQILLYV